MLNLLAQSAANGAGSKRSARQFAGALAFYEQMVPPELLQKHDRAGPCSRSAKSFPSSDGGRHQRALTRETRVCEQMTWI